MQNSRLRPVQTAELPKLRTDNYSAAIRTGDYPATQRGHGRHSSPRHCLWRAGPANFARAETKREKLTRHRRFRIDHSIHHCWR